MADGEATTFSIFYNNTLYLLVVLLSFYFWRALHPGVYPLIVTVVDILGIYLFETGDGLGCQYCGWVGAGLGFSLIYLLYVIFFPSTLPKFFFFPPKGHLVWFALDFKKELHSLCCWCWRSTCLPINWSLSQGTRSILGFIGFFFSFDNCSLVHFHSVLFQSKSKMVT